MANTTSSRRALILGLGASGLATATSWGQQAPPPPADMPRYERPDAPPATQYPPPASLQPYTQQTAPAEQPYAPQPYTPQPYSAQEAEPMTPSQTPPQAQANANSSTYSEDEIRVAATRFFGASAEGMATVVRRVFEDNGQPVGFIEGDEGSGAFTVGLRYGNGRLHMHNDNNQYRVFWRGPTIGWDVGGNGAKVFTLVYGLTDYRQLYKRFPGVEGSAYFVGGVGVNYQRKDGIVLAPMRAGAGLRLGANVGYLIYSPERAINPLF